MKPTKSEHFPDCEGCLRFINNKCNDEKAHLKDDCYQQRESFRNPAFDRWWELHIPN